MNDRAFPLIRLEVEGMKYAILAALNERAVQLDYSIKAAVESYCTEENIDSVVRSTARQAIDAAVKEEVHSFFRHANSGRQAIHEAVTEFMNMVYPVDSVESGSFQDRVQPWLMKCFGPMIAEDIIERNHRFLEEALELVQACGCTESEAHQLVHYVFGRDIGDKPQEVGGVMVTLAALCLAQGMDMHECGETELARIWTKVEQIRAKQAAKPKYSPLPA